MRWRWPWRRNGKALARAEQAMDRADRQDQAADEALASSRELAEWARATTAANRIGVRLDAAYRIALLGPNQQGDDPPR